MLGLLEAICNRVAGLVVVFLALALVAKVGSNAASIQASNLFK